MHVVVGHVQCQNTRPPRIVPRGTWCSGITSASHAEGPGFKSQCVHAHGVSCSAMYQHLATRRTGCEATATPTQLALTRSRRPASPTARLRLRRCGDCLLLASHNCGTSVPPHGSLTGMHTRHTALHMDALGIEPRAFRMLSGCDTTTPRALKPKGFAVIFKAQHAKTLPCRTTVLAGIASVCTQEWRLAGHTHIPSTMGIAWHSVIQHTHDAGFNELPL